MIDILKRFLFTDGISDTSHDAFCQTTRRASATTS